MSARKERPQFGTPVQPGMSVRDIAAALGVSKAELTRWKALAQLPEEGFESRLSALKASGLPITTTAVLGPVPARGRVQRAAAIFNSMTAVERAQFLQRVGSQP